MSSRKLEATKSFVWLSFILRPLWKYKLKCYNWWFKRLAHGKFIFIFSAKHFIQTDLFFCYDIF